MPLIKGKSKRAFEQNIKTEMEHGKPQKQSIAIAYNTQRQAGKRKKMAEGGSASDFAKGARESGASSDSSVGKAIFGSAWAEGGEVSASNEKRPMPDNRYNDSKSVSHNSGDKSPKNDSWTDKSTEAQAQMNNGRKVKPIKRPSMVPTSAFSAKLYNQEGMLEDAASPGPYDSKPLKSYDEEEADKSGPDVPALHMKKMFEGGAVSEEESERDNEPGFSPVKESYMSPSEEEYMSNKMAEGGDVFEGTAGDPQSRPDKGWGAIIVKKAEGGEVTEREEELNHEDPIHEHNYHSDEETEDHDSSIAAAIMAKRRKFAEGGEVDLSINADEEPNHEDQQSFEALKKENYSESESLSQLDSPHDSNEDSVDVDHDPHDMIAAIRRKMKMRNG